MQWLHRRTVVQAILILCVTLALFFITPLTHPHDVYGSDVLLTYRPLQGRIPRGYQLRGGANPDSVTALQPFYYLDREQVRQGTFPLWDPYIGLGAPHLANASSAVLALPTLAFYLLTFKQALLVSAFIKLFLSGIFTYLFLRRVAVSHGAALIGAIAFMYCGYNVYWLPNSAPAVTPMLPMALYFFESAIHVAKNRRIGWFVGLSASVALGVFAGHPETSFYIVLFLAVYMAIRSLVVEQRWRERLGNLVGVAIAALAGILLSAVQLVPFLEYFVNSNAHATRTNIVASPLPPPAWLLNIFPNVYGSPSEPYNVIYKVIVGGGPENLLEANGAYVGALALFLTVVALAFVRKYPLALLFAGGAIVGFAYQYNVFGLINASHLFPLLNQAQPNRSQPVIAFCVSAAAAFAVQGIRETRLGAVRLAALGGAGALFIGVATLLTPLAWRVASLNTHDPAFRAYIPGQLAYVVVSVTAGLVGLVFLGAGRVRPAWLGTAGLALIGAAVFAQGGWLLHDFNPTVPGIVYVPQTATSVGIQRTVGSSNVMMLRGFEIRADTSAFYGLRVMSSYDGLGVRPYYDLYNRLFGGPPELPSPANIDPYILKLFGMNYVVSDQSLGMQIGERAPQPYEGAQPLLQDPITQVFVPGKDGLNQIDVMFANPFPAIDCDVTMVVYADWDRGREVGRNRFACKDIKTPYTSVDFPPEKQSAGKSYRLEIRASRASLTNYLVLLTVTSVTPDGWSLSTGATRIPGTLEYQIQYDAAPDFPRRYRDPLASVYEYLGSPGRFWTVGDVASANTDAQALTMLASSHPDPTRTVVLTAPPIAGLNGEATGAQIVTERADRATVHIVRQSPGYLIAAMTDYPGWKARVNGQSVAVERANYAFMAVPVPAGASTVELYYDPVSFKLGVAVSLMTLLVLLGALLWQRRIPRARNTIEAPVESATAAGIEEK